MVLDCTAGDCSDSAIYLRRRRNGDASVELAAAAAVRMANPRLLAGAGTACAVPSIVRRTGRPRPRTQAPLARPLQEDDAGRAGKIPPSNGRRLRLRISQRREGNIVGGWVMWGQPLSAVHGGKDPKLQPRRTRRFTKEISCLLTLPSCSFVPSVGQAFRGSWSCERQNPTLSLYTSQGEECGHLFFAFYLSSGSAGLRPGGTAEAAVPTWALLTPTRAPGPTSHWLL